jgi:hypothetical protein
MAHRCAEWDGWEEGLVDSILGSKELEEEWFRFDPRSPSLAKASGSCDSSPPSPILDLDGDTLTNNTAGGTNGVKTNFEKDSRRGRAASSGSSQSRRSSLSSISLNGPKVSSKLPFVEEQKKEQMLKTTGDICGGRGGELGRRLEAWLCVNAQNDGGGGSGSGGEGGGGGDDEKRGKAIEGGGAILNSEVWLEGQRTVVALDL